MRLLSFVVRHARKTFALALPAGVISGAANVAFLAVINDALRGGSPTKALMWGFAGLCLALPLTRFVSESLLARFGQGALFELPLWRPMSVETLTGYSLALLYLMNPLQVIINMLPGIGRANIALKKIEELRLSLAAQPTDISTATPPAPSASWGSIELDGITHAYRREREDSSFVLGPIDLTLRQGELAFLVGGNGSGKTTLSKLLVGLYSPEAGQVHLDGRPVTDETREAYRQYFSVVFSDFYLFENLVGLDSPQLDVRAREYLNVLDLAHKVEIKGGALSTTSLSQGQRKRLALLTAYLEDRPIYLFDAWAADQDPHFKEVFYLKLLPELKSRGKTVVVISHDDRYFHVADRIVKLEYGRIVEQTSYEKLAPNHDKEKLPAA
jgi:putative ATP-binding cassette transporter